MNNTLKRIFYVEDDPDIQTIAEIALRDVGGFDIRIYGSGRDAIAAAGGDFLPDLLLLDVMMPDMDGLTTLGHLREFPHLAGVPVIFMTAKVQASEVEQYRELGAAGVIAKPFDPMQLAGMVRTLWAEGAARC